MTFQKWLSEAMQWYCPAPTAPVTASHLVSRTCTCPEWHKQSLAVSSSRLVTASLLDAASRLEVLEVERTSLIRENPETRSTRYFGLCVLSLGILPHWTAGRFHQERKYSVEEKISFVADRVFLRRQPNSADLETRGTFLLQPGRCESASGLCSQVQP